jgi:hypothetical protein
VEPLVSQQGNTPLKGASVRLQSVGTTGLVRNVISDSSGRFLLEKLPADSFSLSVSFVGFKEVTRGFRLDSTTISRDSTGVGTLDVAFTLVPTASQDLTSCCYHGPHSAGKTTRRHHRDQCQPIQGKP